MNTRVLLRVLVVVLLVTAIGGWYAYYREHQRLTSLQSLYLKVQGTVANAMDGKVEGSIASAREGTTSAGQFTPGVFSRIDGTKVIIQQPNEIKTTDGSRAIVYADFQYTLTSTTDLKRYDPATGEYVPTDISAFKTGSRVVLDIAKGSNDQLQLLYLIQ